MDPPSEIRAETDRRPGRKAQPPSANPTREAGDWRRSVAPSGTVPQEWEPIGEARGYWSPVRPASPGVIAADPGHPEREARGKEPLRWRVAGTNPGVRPSMYRHRRLCCPERLSRNPPSPNTR